MNILFNCSEYPPAVAGGIGSVNRIVAEELACRGHHVVVVGYYPGQKQSTIVEEVNGVKVYRLFNTSPRSRWQKKMRHTLDRLHLEQLYYQHDVNWYEGRVLDIIRSEKIQVIELPDYFRFSRYPVPLHFHRYPIPTVLRVHGSVAFIKIGVGDNNPLYPRNDSAHFSRAHYLCSVSHSAQQFIDEVFPDIAFKKKLVINNPIESDFFSLNPPSEQKTILYLGGFWENKGAFSVVEAFGKIADRHPEWNLLLMGK